MNQSFNGPGKNGLAPPQHRHGLWTSNGDLPYCCEWSILLQLLFNACTCAKCMVHANSLFYCTAVCKYMFCHTFVFCIL